MDHIDLKTLGGIAAATTVVVELAKRFAGKWVKGNEMILSLLLPLLFMVASKLSRNFKGSSWTDLVVAILFAAVGAGIAHDKVGKVAAKFFEKSGGGK